VISGPQALVSVTRRTWICHWRNSPGAAPGELNWLRSHLGAHVLRYLVEERYPDAECICVVQDNLNTHTAGALYETFPPMQARRILSRVEFRYTPKHGSWLNQAEIEISIFERGCLSRPVGDMTTLEQRVSALEAERNARRATIEWQFTSPQARIKLKKL
jgi:hypothetical protein